MQYNRDAEEDVTNYATITQKGHYTCHRITTAKNYPVTTAQRLYKMKFNNRISRFAKNIAFQNDSDDVPEDDLDSVGWGARLLGRPLEYVPSEPPNEMPNKDGIQNLLDNKVTAMSLCLGEQRSGFALLKRTLDRKSSGGGDRSNGQGVTKTSLVGDARYRDTCPVFNDDGNYIHISDEQRDDSTINNSVLIPFLQTNSFQRICLVFSKLVLISASKKILLTDYTDKK